DELAVTANRYDFSSVPNHLGTRRVSASTDQASLSAVHSVDRVAHGPAVARGTPVRQAWADRMGGPRDRGEELPRGSVPRDRGVHTLVGTDAIHAVTSAGESRGNRSSSLGGGTAVRPLLVLAGAVHGDRGGRSRLADTCNA